MGAPAYLPSSRLAPVALIRAAGLAPVVAVLKRIGAPAERLLANANLPAFILDDPEALISLGQALRFMEEAARATGIENLGLLAGQGMQIDALGVFGRAIRRSHTLREAIETAIRTMPAFNSGGRYWLAHEGGRVRLCHEFVDGLDVRHPQADQYCLMLALNIVRLAAEPRWRRDDVLLETSRAGGFGDIEVLSDARIAFRQRETAVTFPQSLLSRPLAPAGVTRRIEDADLEAWWASGPASDFPGSVMQVMATLLSSDSPRIGLTASAIGMSVRALPLHPRLPAVDGRPSAGLSAREPEDARHPAGALRRAREPTSRAEPQAEHSVPPGLPRGHLDHARQVSSVGRGVARAQGRRRFANPFSRRADALSACALGSM